MIFSTCMGEQMKQSQRMDADLGMAYKEDLALRQITALKTDMKVALDHVDSMLIDFSEAKALDRSFLQLLCRGHQAMDRLKKILQTGNDPEPVVPFAPPEEFFRHVGCMLGCQDSCLWTEE
jgi:hypothetical protein